MKLKVSRRERVGRATYPGWGCPKISLVIATRPSHSKSPIHSEKETIDFDLESTSLKFGVNKMVQGI
jgi:hypothetical protein